MPSLGRIRLEHPITKEELKLNMKLNMEKKEKDVKHTKIEVQLTEDTNRIGFFGLNITRSEQILNPR